MTLKIPIISLVDLSELLLLRKSDIIFSQLKSKGCNILYSEENWKPLSGGRAYYYCEADTILINNDLLSRFIVQLSKDNLKDSEPFVDGFEIQAYDPLNKLWATKIRTMLLTDFKLSKDSGNGIEIYERGSFEQSILILDSLTESAKVLMHRRSLIRN